MSNVQEFYDNFSQKFINDYVYENPRIQQQVEFFANAIPPHTSKLLVIGCGSGQGAHYIATKVAKNARILAVDISSENIKLANSLFPHKNIEYRQVDVTSAPIEGEWDAIVFPDVYEHIPIASRDNLHSQLNKLLSKKGMILLTIPSPGKQESLYATGEGLQVVDEIVTIEDLLKIGKDVDGVLTYFRMISVWNTNDYIHAIVERGADTISEIGQDDKLPIKGWPHQKTLTLVRVLFLDKLGLKRVPRWWRKQYVNRGLANYK